MSHVWSPLTTHWAVNLADSAPRSRSIDSIGHHHTASPNELVSLQQFAPGGRTVTPNYFIAGKKIYGIVPENLRAFTSSDSINDGRSITYEILNSTAGPNWEFHRDTLETVARLDADIMRRYGIPARHTIPGFWEHRNLWEWFGRSYPTACAGPSFRMQDRIWQAQQEFNAHGSTPKPQEEEVPERKFNQKSGRWALPYKRDGKDVTDLRFQKTEPATGVDVLNLGNGRQQFTVHVYGEELFAGDILELELLWHKDGKESPHYVERITGSGDKETNPKGEFKRTVTFVRDVTNDFNVVGRVRVVKGSAVVTLTGCDTLKWAL